MCVISVFCLNGNRLSDFWHGGIFLRLNLGTFRLVAVSLTTSTKASNAFKWGSTTGWMSGSGIKGIGGFKSEKSVCESLRPLLLWSTFYALFIRLRCNQISRFNCSIFLSPSGSFHYHFVQNTFWPQNTKKYPRNLAQILTFLSVHSWAFNQSQRLDTKMPNENWS